MLVRVKHLKTYRVRGKTFYYHRITKKRLANDRDKAVKECLAINASLEGSRPHPDFDTLAHLIGVYKASPEYKRLSSSSRREYERYLTLLSDRFGSDATSGLSRATFYGMRDGMADRPRSANYALAVAKRLFSFGISRGLIERNPVLGVEPFKITSSYDPWPEAAIERFREKAEPEAVWAMELGLGTGQRQSDCLTALWSHYDGEGFQVTQRKTGEKLWVPAHPELKKALTRIPRRAAVILTSRTELSWKADHFRHVFRKNVVACGLDGLVFHGLRHTAATRLADAGCDDRDIMAITGHATVSMVQRYTRKADQKRRAKAAIAKLPMEQSEPKSV